MTRLKVLLTAAVLFAGSCAAALAQGTGPNASLSVTTTSSNVALPAPAPSNWTSVLIAPASGGSQEVFYNFGTDNTVTAVAGTSKALPGGGICVAIGNAKYLAAVTATSTATLRITQLSGCAEFAAAGGAGGGGGGGGGAVYGPTAAGVAAANPPVVIGGTSDGTAAGNVGVLRVLGGLGYVNCANCSGSGVSAADTAAFVAGTSLLAPTGGFYQTTATANALTNGQQGMAQMTANRALFSNLRNASGTEIATAAAPLRVDPTGTTAQPVTGTFWQTTQPVSGTFWQATQPISAAALPLPTGAATQTTVAAINTTLGTPFQAGGSIGNTSFGISGTVPNPTTAASWGLIAQASTTSGQIGQLAMGAVTTAAPTYTTAQSAPLSLDTTGALRVNVTAGGAGGGAVTQASGSVASGAYSSGALAVGAGTDGWDVTNGAKADAACGTATGTCSVTALVKYLNTQAAAIAAAAITPPPVVGSTNTGASVAINVSTATTTQLVAISASTLIYVTSFDIVAGGTGNATFVYGTGTNCGTGTTALTGPYNLTAQAGVAKGSGTGMILKVPAGNALCLTTSAAVQMSGSVSYLQQ